MTTKQNKRSILLLVIAAAIFYAASAGAAVKEVFLTPHFHYDPVFVRDQRDYTEVGFDRCRRYFEALGKDPDYAVVFSEIDYLKPWYDTHPEDRAEIRRLVAENRIETGGSYNEPNEMSIGGEGLIRNIVYGRAWQEGVLGDRNAGVYMPFDVFGHTLQWTQILKKSRYEGAVWRKGNPPAESWTKVTVPGLPPDFIDVAPDGSTLHHRREHYKALSNTGSAEKLMGMVDKKKQLQDSLGLVADFGLLSTDDFAFPEPWLAGNAGLLKQHDPPIILSGPTAYFRAIRKQLEDGPALSVEAMPEVTRDFSLYHAGTALSRTDLKVANRLAENELLTAEKFSVAAALMGAPYPEPALDLAWRQLLFNQHHDGITGTSNDRSFFDMMAGYREAMELAVVAKETSYRRIANEIKMDSNRDIIGAIVVFNPLGWKRTDMVTARVEMQKTEGEIDSDVAVLRDTDSCYKSRKIRMGIRSNSKTWKIIDTENREVPFVIVEDHPTWNPHVRFLASDVPSVGYKTYYIVPGKPKPVVSSLSAKGNTIENEFYSVTVDPARGGTITGLRDKKAGRDIVTPNTKITGNELIVLKEDSGTVYPAWELSTTGVKDMSSKHPATVTTSNNAIQAKLVIDGEIPGLGGYTQEITLYKGIKRIDMRTTIRNPAPTDSAADRNLWMVRFPAKLNGTAPVVEDRFYVASRRRSLKPLQYRTDLEKMLTLSAPYSALNWVEEGSTVRVDVRDAKGQIVDAVAIGLCGIVHSHNPDSIAAADSLQRALIRRGVTCTPAFDTENQDTDLLNRGFRFVIDIGADNSYAQTLTTSSDFPARLARDKKARMLMKAHTNDMEIRSVDTLVLGATDAKTMSGMIGNLTQSIIDSARIKLTEPEDARAERVIPDDYGIALINHGSLLHSFDSNGSIVMGLFHQAPWSASLMGLRFDFPESKDNRSEYSLYPHAGDWRQADTWKVGHEVNAPLDAVYTSPEPQVCWWARTDLPVETGLFDIQSRSTALSAIKVQGVSNGSIDAIHKTPKMRISNNRIRVMRLKRLHQFLRLYPDVNQRRYIYSQIYELREENERIVKELNRKHSNNKSKEHENKNARGRIKHDDMENIPIPTNHFTRRIAMRFYETEGSTDSVRIHFFRPVRAAWRANLIEEIIPGSNIPVRKGNLLEFPIGPDAIETIIVDLYGTSDIIDSFQENTSHESEIKTFSNYWELNRGAAGILNAPLSVSIDFPPPKTLPDPAMLKMNLPTKQKERQIKKGENPLRLMVSNNSLKEPIQGVVNLVTPLQISVATKTFGFRLGPGQGKIWDISVTQKTSSVTGYIRAETNGYFDALTIGRHDELSVETKTRYPSWSSPFIEVLIRNNQRGRIDGDVEAIAPVEAWPQSLAGGLSRTEIKDWRFPFSLESDKETNLKVPICRTPGETGETHFWIVLKIAYNGDLKYIPLQVMQDENGKLTISSPKPQSPVKRDDRKSEGE